MQKTLRGPQDEDVRGREAELHRMASPRAPHRMYNTAMLALRPIEIRHQERCNYISS